MTGLRALCILVRISKKKIREQIMRRCLVLLAFVLLIAFGVGGAYGEAPKVDGLALKVHEFVSQEYAAAFYAWTAKAAKKRISALKKQFAKDLTKLKKMAEKGDPQAKDLQAAVAQFEASIGQCAHCEHEYRRLNIDLISFLECKEKSCKPMDEAREKVAAMARAAKKAK